MRLRHRGSRWSPGRASRLSVFCFFAFLGPKSAQHVCQHSPIHWYRIVRGASRRGTARRMLATCGCGCFPPSYLLPQYNAPRRGVHHRRSHAPHLTACGVHVRVHMYRVAILHSWPLRDVVRGLAHAPLRSTPLPSLSSKFDPRTELTCLSNPRWEQSTRCTAHERVFFFFCGRTMSHVPRPRLSVLVLFPPSCFVLPHASLSAAPSSKHASPIGGAANSLPRGSPWPR